MDNILLVDVETTGLDREQDEILEVGAVLYSLELGAILAQFSAIVPADVTEIATTKIHGITPAMVAASDQIPFHASDTIEMLASVADAAVAHNCEFDKAFCSRAGMLENIPWVDTLDFEFTRTPFVGGSLSSIAPYYDVPVWNPHRALPDCQMLAEILTREPDRQRLMERAARPKVPVVAACSYENAKGKQALKEHRFHWGDDSPVPGYAHRLIPADDIPSLTQQIGPTGVAVHQWAPGVARWYSMHVPRHSAEIKAIAKNYGFRWNPEGSPAENQWVRVLMPDDAKRLINCGHRLDEIGQFNPITSSK